MHHKADYVHSFGRVSSILEMSHYNATLLIKELEKRKAARPVDPQADAATMDNLRKKILSCCYELGWTFNSTDGKRKVDFVRLNAFLLAKGVVSKKLDKLDYNELNKTIGQFKGMVENNGKQAAVAAAREILNPKKN